MGNIKKIQFANVLIKFIEEQYIDDTLVNGFYFNKLRNFKDIENLNESQLDKDEGCIIDFARPQEVELLDTDFSHIANIDVKNISSWKSIRNFNLVDNLPICCFTLLQFPHDFDFIDKCKTTYRYKIKSKIIDKLNDIADNRPFVYCLEQSMTNCLNESINKGRDIKAKKVIYYKEKNKNIDYRLGSKIPLNIIFMKNEKYKSQKEYRIVLGDRNDNCFFMPPNLELEKGRSDSLYDFNMIINKKYDDKHVSIQLKINEE